MTRLSLTLRMLVLVPLLATGIDFTRATLACSAQAQTCLEAAGRGWMGPLAVGLVMFGAAGAALALARGARSAGPQRSLPRLWALGTTGLLVACTAQHAVARAAGGGEAALGGSPLALLALCAIAGAFLALAMRVAGDATALLADLRPRAPRARFGGDPVTLVTRREAVFAPVAAGGTQRGRAPPAA